jgi:hypothetical protein
MPKDRFTHDFNGREIKKPFQTIVEEDLATLAFDIDPSLHLSSMRSEIHEIASYLMTRHAYLEVHDADSRFLVGVGRIPLYDLLRQQRQQVHRLKDVEICKFDNADEVLGSVQIALSAFGHTMHEKYIQTGASSKPTFKKYVSSGTIDPSRVNSTHNPMNKPLFAADPVSTVRGGVVLDQQIRDGANKPPTSLDAIFVGEDLQKKRDRVWRMRQQNLGGKAMLSAVDDLQQPAWAK